MGREIRRVPPSWEHPTQECPHSPWAGGCEEAKRSGGRCYKPLYDQTFEEAAANWKAGFAAWEAGGRAEHPEYEFWEWDSQPPDREYYRPAFTEEPTWYQVYQTVSEGTPVTPPFPSKAALEEYLVAHGSFWDERGWSREVAEQFVEIESAPSLMVFNGSRGNVVHEPRDGPITEAEMEPVR